MKEAFVVLPGALQREVLEPLVRLFTLAHQDPKSRYPGQSGIALAGWPGVLDVLQPLAACASEYIGTELEIIIGRSSCRRQTPDGEAQLTLHQDQIALDTNDPNDPRAVFWVPLCDIDEYTPTLEVCPVRLDHFVEHHSDDLSYSVARSDHSSLPLVAISRLSLGDVLLMRSTTLHRTSVKPWHTKTRISLDVRLLPPVVPILNNLVIGSVT